MWLWNLFYLSSFLPKLFYYLLDGRSKSSLLRKLLGEPPVKLAASARTIKKAQRSGNDAALMGDHPTWQSEASCGVLLFDLTEKQRECTVEAAGAALRGISTKSKYLA